MRSFRWPRPTASRCAAQLSSLSYTSKSAISSGLNWSYGSGSPNSQLLASLSRELGALNFELSPLAVGGYLELACQHARLFLLLGSVLAELGVETMSKMDATPQGQMAAADAGAGQAEQPQAAAAAGGGGGGDDDGMADLQARLDNLRRT